MNILVICHYGLYQDLTSSFVHNQLRELVALGNNVRVIVPNGIGKAGMYRQSFLRCLPARALRQICHAAYVAV